MALLIENIEGKFALDESKSDLRNVLGALIEEDHDSNYLENQVGIFPFKNNLVFVHAFYTFIIILKPVVFTV